MTLRQLLSIMLIGLVVLGPAGGALAQDGGPGVQSETAATGTAFTYQGRLDNGGTGVTNTCGFQFGMWDALNAGAQLGITQTVASVSVNAGYFTVWLNGSNEFGSTAFNGTARWLAITVRCPDSGGYTPLNPRQALTAAPYALFATGNWGLNGNAGTTSANFLGTTDNLTLTLKVNGQTAFRLGPNATAVNVLGGAGSNNILAGAYGGFIGGGTGNVISPSVAYGVIAGGTTNRSGSFEAVVGGGQNNYADGFQSVISGGASNHTFGTSTTVGGGFSNDAGASEATVAGGYNNSATGNDATVAGGRNNIAGGVGAFVGGGGFDGVTTTGNAAWGDASAVVGGLGNVITSTGDYAFIGGGLGNDVSANYAAILGGQDNTATGLNAAVLGGKSNSANASYGVALGFGAHADLAGSLVWVCASCPVTTAGTANAAYFNSDNGFWFGRGVASASTPTISATAFISTSSGAYLSTAGVWTDVSDRNAKINFAPVSVLDTLLGLPVESWQYKVDDANVRHIGPTAQDFYAAFGVGQDDTHLAALDTSGVALAAVQELAQVVQAKDAEIAALKADQASLDARLAAVEAHGAAGSGANTLQLIVVLVAGMLAGAVIGAGAFALGRRKA